MHLTSQRYAVHARSKMRSCTYAKQHLSSSPEVEREHDLSFNALSAATSSLHTMSRVGCKADGEHEPRTVTTWQFVPDAGLFLGQKKHERTVTTGVAQSDLTPQNQSLPARNCSQSYRLETPNKEVQQLLRKPVSANAIFDISHSILDESTV